MVTIEGDFDIYKELTMLRASEEVTYSDVIKNLLRNHIRPNGPASKAISDGWHVKGAFFPHGTEFRATYKGKVYTGVVQESGVVVNGRVYHTPSAAAHSITQTNLNGWGFWECKLPGESDWKPIYALRPE